MKLFVTGGNGFVGSAVVRDAVAQGREVMCLLRPTSRTDRIDGVPIERIFGDVRDVAVLRAAMRQCDATIHLAAPSSWDGDASPAVDEIIEGGTRNVLAAAEGLRGHRVVVVSSTAAIACSDRPQVFDERAPFAVGDPSLRYAHAKHRAELAAWSAFARGVEVVVVNPGEVYGPNDTASVTAGNLIDFATAFPVLVCHGGTGIVHVDDVSRGILAAAQRGRPGERYILSGENVSIRELAALCVELLGRRVPIVSVPNWIVRPLARAAARFRIPVPFNAHVVPYATRYWFVDNGKARRELGVNFRDARATVASTLDWLRASSRLTHV